MAPQARTCAATPTGTPASTNRSHRPATRSQRHSATVPWPPLRGATTESSEAERGARDEDSPRGDVRAVARTGHDHAVWQPRLHGAADAERLPGGLPLRA